MLPTHKVVNIECVRLLGPDLLVFIDVLDVLMVAKAVDSAFGVDGPVIKRRLAVGSGLKGRAGSVLLEGLDEIVLVADLAALLHDLVLGLLNLIIAGVVIEYNLSWC